MTVDVVCAGPPFLDLVFQGLPHLPAAGEEVLANEVTIVPGAMANVAHALRRLDVDAVVCAPIGTDPVGRLLQALMAEADIPWWGQPTPATPLSVALPVDGERAFVTHFPTAELDVAAIADARARAVVVNLPLPTGFVARLSHEPGAPMRQGTTPRVVGVVGDPQVALLREQAAGSWSDLHAVVFNEREALQVSGRADAVAAAGELAERGCLVIVTRGERGVVAARPDGECHEAAGVPVHARDTVGAGDLFTAAWLWADLADRPLDESLAVATAYAAHSLAAPGPGQKGLSRAAFMEVGRLSGGFGSWMQEVRG